MKDLPPVAIEHPHVELSTELDGSPVVRGSKVPVRRLWAWHRRGTTIETLFKRYPQLGPARVLDALAFAYDNQDLMAADLAREHEMLPPDPTAEGTQRKLPF